MMRHRFRKGIYPKQLVFISWCEICISECIHRSMTYWTRGKRNIFGIKSVVGHMTNNQWRFTPNNRKRTPSTKWCFSMQRFVFSASGILLTCSLVRRRSLLVRMKHIHRGSPIVFPRWLIIRGERSKEDNANLRSPSPSALSTAREIRVHLFWINNRFVELQMFNVDAVATSGMTSKILCDVEQLLVINDQFR